MGGLWDFIYKKECHRPPTQKKKMIINIYIFFFDVYRHCIFIKILIQYTSATLDVLHEIRCDQYKIMCILDSLSKTKTTLYIDFFMFFNKKCILSDKNVVFTYKIAHAFSCSWYKRDKK